MRFNINLNKNKVKKYLHLLTNIFLVLIVIHLCLISSLNRIRYSDFNPLDGDFQNYNGFRRVLDGQVPFREFYFYIGMGPLYLGSLALFLIGNTFTNSLFITSFLSAFLFSVSVFVISFIAGLRIQKSLMITIIMGFLASGFFDTLYSSSFISRDNVEKLFFVGNSFRMARAILPTLVVIGYLVIRRFSFKFKNGLWKTAIYGLLLGGCIGWSNDFGISVILAGVFVFMIAQKKVNWNSIRNIFLLVSGCVIGGFITINLLTLGNFDNWFKYNFIGVRNFQPWYFGVNPATKLFSIIDVHVSYETLILFLIAVYLTIKILQRRNTKNEPIFLFLILCFLIADYAYSIGGASTGLLGVSHCYFYVILLCFIIINVEQKFKPAFQSYFVVFFTILSSIVVFGELEASISNLDTQREVYISKLGGYLTYSGPELIDISEDVIKGQMVFSTYASVIEVLNNQFQPTGFDYAIHVLGDDYREMYLSEFYELEPPLVLTIRPDYTYWAYWSKRANWFFYRAFLGRYKPIDVSPYHIIWERQPYEDRPAFDTSVSITVLSPSQVKISVLTNPIVADVVIDMNISYDTTWRQRTDAFFFLRKMVGVHDDSLTLETNGSVTAYFLPDANRAVNIPIEIDNGHGEVILTSYPSEHTILLLNSYRIDNVFYDVPEEFSLYYPSIEPYYIGLGEIKDQYWDYGNSRSDNILLFNFSVRKWDIISHSESMSCGNEERNIINVEIIDNYWIRVIYAGDKIPAREGMLCLFQE